MLNEEKVRMMTRLASYEQNEGKKYLPVSKFYRSDYIGLALIKNFFLVTIGYILLLVIVAGYFAEDLMDNIHKMNLVAMGIGVIGVYLIILALYSLLIYILYTVRYSNAKKSVKKYYAQLGEITALYLSEEQKTGTSATGRRS